MTTVRISASRQFNPEGLSLEAIGAVFVLAEKAKKRGGNIRAGENDLLKILGCGLYRWRRIKRELLRRDQITCNHPKDQQGLFRDQILTIPLVTEIL